MIASINEYYLYALGFKSPFYYVASYIYIIESYIVRYGLLIGIAAYVIEFTLRGVMAYTVLRVQGLTLFCYINFSWYGTRYVIANSSLFVHFTD